MGPRSHTPPIRVRPGCIHYSSPQSIRTITHVDIIYIYIHVYLHLICEIPTIPRLDEETTVTGFPYTMGWTHMQLPLFPVQFPRHQSIQSIQSSNQSYRNTQTITDTYSNKNNFIRTTGLSKAADFALNQSLNRTPVILLLQSPYVWLRMTGIRRRWCDAPCRWVSWPQGLASQSME